MLKWFGWLTNALALEGCRGNVEHLRKAAGLLSTAGSQKTGSCFRRHFQSNGAHLAARAGALVFVQLL